MIMPEEHPKHPLGLMPGHHDPLDHGLAEVGPPLPVEEVLLEEGQPPDEIAGRVRVLPTGSLFDRVSGVVVI